MSPMIVWEVMWFLLRSNKQSPNAPESVSKWPVLRPLEVLEYTWGPFLVHLGMLVLLRGIEIGMYRNARILSK